MASVSCLYVNILYNSAPSSRFRIHKAGQTLYFAASTPKISTTDSHSVLCREVSFHPILVEDDLKYCRNLPKYIRYLQIILR